MGIWEKLRSSCLQIMQIFPSGGTLEIVQSRNLHTLVTLQININVFAQIEPGIQYDQKFFRLNK